MFHNLVLIFALIVVSDPCKFTWFVTPESPTRDVVLSSVEHDFVPHCSHILRIKTTNLSTRENWFLRRKENKIYR